MNGFPKNSRPESGPRLSGGLRPPRDLFGIIGRPVSHSLSPALHTWACARFGHPGAYFAWEPEEAELPAFFQAVRLLPVRGLSVTLPYKTAVIPLLDQLTDRAARVGAVNTVFWQNGRLTGENTDVDGFCAPFEGLAPENRRFAAALILGAGGVCRAALEGVRELGVPRVFVAARRLAAAREVIQHRAADTDAVCEAVPWEDRETPLAEADLVVNATPLGMRGKDEDQSPLPPNAWNAAGARGAAPLAYDLVYTPGRTRFLREAEAAGIRTQNGLRFFAAQGLAQFRLWTGIIPSSEDAAQADSLICRLLAER